MYVAALDAALDSGALGAAERLVRACAAEYKRAVYSVRDCGCASRATRGALARSGHVIARDHARVRAYALIPISILTGTLI